MNPALSMKPKRQPGNRDPAALAQARGCEKEPESLLQRVAALSDGLTSSDALREVLIRLMEHLWFAYGAIYSTSDGGRHFDCLIQCKPADCAPVLPFSGEELSCLRRAAATRKPVFYSASARARRGQGQSRPRSLYAVPLVTRTRAHGVLSVHTTGDCVLHGGCRKLIDRFGPPASVAFERLQLDSVPSRAQNLLQPLLAQQQVGVALAALDGTLQQPNRYLAALLGFVPESLTGKLLADLVPEQDRAKFVEATRQAAAGESHPGFPLHRYVSQSGKDVWCATELSAVPGAGGRPETLLLLVTDKTTLKQAEDARARLEDEALQAQKIQTLGMLAGGVAHDFNNALEVIMGFASLALLRLSPGDAMHEPLKIIAESASGAAALARELLDAARKDEARPEPIDVAQLVNSVNSIISRTFDRKIRVECRADPHSPQVQGFPSRFEQALLNLCINARDAMPEGGTLTLETTTESVAANDPRRPASAPQGEYVRLAVRDTGTGMSAETLEQICTPRFTTKPKGRHSGLGLTMVERIIKMAGGFIAVRSAPGEGTEFALYLPAVSQRGPANRSRRDNRLVTGRGTVLVVDDEPRVLDFLQKGLTRLGYKVLCAETGKGACEIYSRQPQDFLCVLLDMIMPDISGLETYDRLKDIDPEVKVILSSGYNSSRVKRRVQETVGANFLGKPYTIETLSQAIRKVQEN